MRRKLKKKGKKAFMLLKRAQDTLPWHHSKSARQAGGKSSGQVLGRPIAQ